MAMIDLRDYSVITRATLVRANEIILEQVDDEVTLTGPVHVCVRLQAINKTTDPNGQVFTQYHDVYQYNWMVPAGQAGRLKSTEALQQLRLGANHGSRIVICPAGPQRSPAVRTTGDLPCDFAVGDIPDTGQFFPSGCEPCPPGKSIALPPGTTPTLITPPAEGGCVRTRFFNGMFITQEDLETEQRFFRMKNKLQNQTVGEGVVWGLDVDCHGDAVCVHPGYALDCCGNTLIVTTPYKVDVESLLRDPVTFQYLIQKPTATSSRCGDRNGISAIDRVTGIRGRLDDVSRKMHLLLEYVECPEKPRPVHGDPCSPDVTHCEMSRTRETVRLRLVPPREPDTSGPIERFLEEVEKLKKEGKIGDLPEIGKDPGQPGTSADIVPFSLELQIGDLPAATLQPSVTLQQATTQTTTRPATLIVRVIPTAGWSLIGGALETAGGAPIQVDPTNPIPLSWSVDVAAGEREFRIQNWVAAPLFQGDKQTNLTGATVIRTNVVIINTGAAQIAAVAVTVEPTAVTTVEPALGPYPCTGAACGEDSLGGLFQLLPPFLHQDPLRPGKAVDWKVLLAAATYGWLASEMVRHKVGTSKQVVTSRLTLALFIYLYALRLLCGKLTAQQAVQISKELRCLFDAWCKSFIYAGPRCDENPVGVVIGCVRIQGGSIRELDPLGDRRWVVTYPLLSHWGRLFGIAPLDVTMSRFFNLICCIGDLPAFQTPRDSGSIQGGNSVWQDSKTLFTGNVHLFEGSKAEARAELSKVKITPVRERTVATDEFVANLTTGLRTTEVPPGTNFELLSLRDSPDVHIAVPVEASAVAKPDPLEAVVRAFAPPDTAARRKVPVLVRSKSDELTANVINQAPIAKLEESGVAEEFAKAQILTYGALLSADPDEIAENVLRGEKSKEFSLLYQQSEKQTETIAKTVNDIVAKVSLEKEITSPEGLRSEEAVKAVTEALAEKLSKGRQPVIPRATLEAVVGNTLKAGKKRR